MKNLLILPTLISAISNSAIAEDSKPLVFTVVPSQTAQGKQDARESKIEIIIKNARPAESQRIMEAVSRALGQTTGPQDLETAIKEQKEKVDELRKTLTVLIQSPGFLELPLEEVVKLSRQRLVDLKEQRDLIELQIKRLNELDAEALITYAASLDVPQNQVSVSYQKHRETLAKRKELVADGLGPVHPNVRVQEDIAQATKAQAKLDTLALKENLKTKLELIDRQLIKINDLIETRKPLSEEEARKETTYLKTKAAYEKARKMLEELQAKEAAMNK